MRDGLGYLPAAAAFKALRVDHNDVMQVLDASIAQHASALADRLCRVNLADRQVLMIARKGQRTNLQESEVSWLLSARQCHSKFHFHRISQRFLAGAHERVENVRHRKESMLQHGCKRNDARPGA